MNEFPSKFIWQLLLAFVVGVIYVFLVPPWQHNDEPTNFEYTWLVAHKIHWPQQGDQDLPLRREIAASMMEHNFNSNYKPSLVSITGNIDIGISQLDGLPLYYFFSSLPLRILPNADITFQLYLARFVSLVFFLLIIFFSSLASQEILGNHPLSKMAPLVLIMFPGFVNSMTAVNDDVVAVFSMTLFIWISLRLIKHGLNIWNFILLLLSMVLCLLSKKNAWVALPFSFITIYLSLLRRHINYAWVGLFCISILLIGLSLSWSDTTPAYYYVSSNSQLPSNPSSIEAIKGNKIIRLTTQKSNIYQTMDTTSVNLIKGRKVIIGGWVWSEKETKIKSPELLILTSDNLVPPMKMKTENLLPNEEFIVEKEAIFVKYPVAIPNDVNSIVVKLSSSSQSSINWDCLILIQVDSIQDPKSSPNPMDKQCSQILWDNKVYANLIKNASMEESWPTLKPSFGKWADQFFSFSITDLLVIFDKPVALTYFQSVGANLFRTFWGGFGWGRVHLLGSKPYRIFIVLTILAFWGILLNIREQPYRSSWSSILFLFLLSAIVILLALYRGAGNWYEYIFTPVARYLYPVILPIALFFSTGWFTLMRRLKVFHGISIY
jgi:hypothetical protein